MWVNVTEMTGDSGRQRQVGCMSTGRGKCTLIFFKCTLKALLHRWQGNWERRVLVWGSEYAVLGFRCWRDIRAGLEVDSGSKLGLEPSDGGALRAWECSVNKLLAGAVGGFGEKRVKSWEGPCIQNQWQSQRIIRTGRRLKKVSTGDFPWQCSG